MFPFTQYSDDVSARLDWPIIDTFGSDQYHCPLSSEENANQPVATDTLPTASVSIAEPSFAQQNVSQSCDVPWWWAIGESCTIKI